MKNIVAIEPNEMEEFFATFWKTKEFISLQKNHPFFKSFIEKLKKSPIFFFDLTNEKGRYHLSSHIRFIAHRDYESDYLRDLYYFHELLHCAEFEPDNGADYSKWKEKLNSNELYASIVSEVLIYYMEPSMIGKTFNPLWAEKFYKNDVESGKNAGNYGFFEENTRFDPMSFSQINDWPRSVQEIYVKRNLLRLIYDEDEVEDPAEKFIVKYNKSRISWIEKWKPHYIKIDTLLIKLHNKEITTQKYLDEVLLHCDEDGRAFFPK